MAKVTITFEDIPGGKIKVVSDPKFETFMKMISSGEDLTSAQGLAISALNHIYRETKSKEPTKIWVPRIGR